MLGLIALRNDQTGLNLGSVALQFLLLGFVRPAVGCKISKNVSCGKSVTEVAGLWFQ